MNDKETRELLEKELRDIEKQLMELDYTNVVEEDQLWELENELEEAAYIKAYESVYDYLIYSWNTFEPSQFKQSKHLHAIGEHLDACLAGQIRNLIINIAPRNSKTALTTRAFPTYCWIKRPQLKIINISYSNTLAVDDSVKSKQIINSDWYKRGLYTVWAELNKWDNVWKLDTSQKNQQGDYYNTANGRRYATSTGGTLTGTGGDIIIIDDPLNANDADSVAMKRNCNEWCSGVLSTRLNDKETGIRILVMQRLAEDDLTGYLKEQGNWEILKIPSEWDETKRYWTSIGWTDWRTSPKELMNPARFPRNVIEELKIELGEYNYAAQHQQEPIKEGGGIIKEEWLKKWYILPNHFDSMCISIDLTFKDELQNHNNAMIVLGRKSNDYYLIDLIYGKMDIVKQLENLTTLSEKYYYVRSKLIEVKANGNAVYNLLKNKISGLIPVDPKGIDKITRIKTIIPIIQAGQLYIPDKEICEWVKPFLRELTSFPKGRYDDILDALSYGINYLETNVIYTKMPAVILNTTEGIKDNTTGNRKEIRETILNNSLNSSRSYIRNIFNS